MMDGIKKKKLHESRRTTLAMKKEQAEEAKTQPAKKIPEGTHVYSKILLEWEPLEYQKREKGENWYLWLGMAAALAITIAIFTKAYIAAVTFFLLAIVLVMYAQRDPETINVKITDTGIELNKRFLPYHKIGSFWILYDPPHVTTLCLQERENLKNIVTIEIDEEDPVQIRDTCSEVLHL